MSIATATQLQYEQLRDAAAVVDTLSQELSQGTRRYSADWYVDVDLAVVELAGVLSDIFDLPEVEGTASVQGSPSYMLESLRDTSRRTHTGVQPFAQGDRSRFQPGYLDALDATCLACYATIQDIRGQFSLRWSGLPVYTDTEGTTEATWGDPVGLIRDASPNGADFTQPTVTARPILGRVPRGGRRNLYTNSQPDINNPQWSTFTLGEGSIVTRIGREPGPNGIDGIRYQFERPVSGFAVVGGNLAGYPAGDYTHSLWAKSGDGETYTVAFYTQSSPGLSFEVGPEWQRLVIPSYRDEDGAQRYLWFGVRDTVSAYNTFADIIIADGQFEIGEEATAFQQVITTYDITEEGVEDIHYLDFDRTDDNLTTTLPAIENGTVVIAGTNGIWIDDDYNFDGGTFSIGPTTYTGGPAGILEVIGDPIERGFLVINRQLSQRERELVIQEMKERGAPGVFEMGPELVFNGDFSDGLEGWNSRLDGDGGPIPGGIRLEYSTTNAQIWQFNAVEPGELYIGSFRLLSVSPNYSGSVFLKTNTINDASSRLSRALGGIPGIHKGVSRAHTGAISLWLGGPRPLWADVTDISVRKLELIP